jgi:hypothetical protein
LEDDSWKEKVIQSLRSEWNNDIKMDLKEAGSEGMNWIEFTQELICIPQLAASSGPSGVGSILLLCVF